MKRYLFLFLFSLFFYSGYAQYFQTGQDPASIKWRQINTPDFQMIYPDYYELQAQKLAHVLEKVYNYGSYSLKYKPRKISVILHTQTVQSNGLVAWAPRRAEFYTTPHQAIYPQDWLDQLALHEFRHVVQVDKINSELPNIIKWITGEQGTALFFGAYLPWWFIEGDAVVTETALSNYGRGRLPSFLMEHKAQVVEKGVYSYDKAYNGSFKDFVPNHYKLGYYLVGNSRVRYGSKLWENVLDNVGKKPFSLNPFNKELKQDIGYNKVTLYKSIFDSLNVVWTLQDQNYKSTLFEQLSPENKSFTNYKYAHYLNDSTLISYRTSLNRIPSFVRIDKSGRESNVFFPGNIFDESVNYRDNLIIWSEQIPDMRWSHSGKSLIRIYSITSHNIQEIHTEFKSFSPAISPDKNEIAVVESDYTNNYYLSVYSTYNGKLLHRIQTKDNNYFFSPVWINLNELAAILLTNDGKRLAKVNFADNTTEILSERNMGNLKQLQAVGDKLFFISSYTGKDGLYSFNLKNGDIHFLYEPRFGVESPDISTNSQKIVLSDYTADGFRLIEIPAFPENQFSIDDVKKGEYPLAEKLASQEMGVLDFTDIDSTKYPSKRYLKIAHLFHFHSWAPVSIDVQKYAIEPGISMMSQNILGTSEIILGYKRDLEERTGKFYANYSFKGWYPVMSFEINSGKSAQSVYMIQKTVDQSGNVIRQDTTLERITWNNTKAKANLRIPLDLTKGAFNRMLQPEVQFESTYYSHDNTTPSNFFQGCFSSMAYRLYYHQLLKKSYMDVYPDFGFVIDATYRNSVKGITMKGINNSETVDFGDLKILQSILYLPGFLKNHGIRFYSGVQWKKLNDDYGFTDAIKYPRGWGKRNTTKMVSMAADYKFPLFYPEISLGGLVYLKRVNASLFADYANLKGNVNHNNTANTFSEKISSFGMELTGDINFLRFYAPTSAGVRASYIPKTNNVYFDFLFSINLGSL